MKRRLKPRHRQAGLPGSKDISTWLPHLQSKPELLAAPSSVPRKPVNRTLEPQKQSINFNSASESQTPGSWHCASRARKAEKGIAGNSPKKVRSSRLQEMNEAKPTRPWHVSLLKLRQAHVKQLLSSPSTSKTAAVRVSEVGSSQPPRRSCLTKKERLLHALALRECHAAALLETPAQNFASKRHRVLPTGDVSGKLGVEEIHELVHGSALTCRQHEALVRPQLDRVYRSFLNACPLLPVPAPATSP